MPTSQAYHRDATGKAEGVYVRGIQNECLTYRGSYTNAHLPHFSDFSDSAISLSSHSFSLLS